MNIQDDSAVESEMVLKKCVSQNYSNILVSAGSQSIFFTFIAKL